MWKVQMVRKGQVIEGRPVYFGVSSGNVHEIHMMPDTDPAIFKEMNRAVRDQAAVELDTVDIHHISRVGV